MPRQSSRVIKLLTASMFALAVASAPVAGLSFPLAAAHAEGGGIPDPSIPDPGPVPAASSSDGSAGCQPDETFDPSNGNCVPAMTAITTTQGDQQVEELQPHTTQTITSTADTGIGADMVPNINGYPCTGYWESAACYEAGQDGVAVQPKSTLSSSP